MYSDESITVTVFTGINFNVTTPGRYYCEVSEQRGVYRSNSFTVYEIGKCTHNVGYELLKIILHSINAAYNQVVGVTKLYLNTPRIKNT